MPVVVKIRNSGGAAYTLTASKVTSAVTHEMTAHNPAGAKGGATSRQTVMTPTGKVFTVYVVEGFVLGPDDQTIEDMFVAIRDWWTGLKTIYFTWGLRAEREVIFLNFRARRLAQSAQATWTYTLEMRRADKIT